MNSVKDLSYMDLVTVSSFITPVAVIAGVLVFWVKGGNQASTEVLETYKLQVEQLKERVSTCEELHRQNLSNIGKLEGMMSTKDDRIVYLETVLKDRNPETTKFMEHISGIANEGKTFMREQSEWMKQSIERDKILSEILTFMRQLNSHFPTPV